VSRRGCTADRAPRVGRARWPESTTASTRHRPPHGHASTSVANQRSSSARARPRRSPRCRCASPSASWRAIGARSVRRTRRRARASVAWLVQLSARAVPPARQPTGEPTVSHEGSLSCRAQRPVGARGSHRQRRSSASCSRIVDITACAPCRFCGAASTGPAPRETSRATTRATKARNAASSPAVRGESRPDGASRARGAAPEHRGQRARLRGWRAVAAGGVALAQWIRRRRIAPPSGCSRDLGVVAPIRRGRHQAHRHRRARSATGANAHGLAASVRAAVARSRLARPRAVEVRHPEPLGCAHRGRRHPARHEPQGRRFDVCQGRGGVIEDPRARSPRLARGWRAWHRGMRARRKQARPVCRPPRLLSRWDQFANNSPSVAIDSTLLVQAWTLSRGASMTRCSTTESIWSLKRCRNSCRSTS
jgi:hypothetical protein